MVHFHLWLKLQKSWYNNHLTRWSQTFGIRSNKISSSFQTYNEYESSWSYKSKMEICLYYVYEGQSAGNLASRYEVEECFNINH